MVLEGPAAIHFTKHETMTKVYFDLIRNYDNSEIDRVASYNQAFIPAAARRRVIKFTQLDTNGAPIIYSKDRVDRIKPLVLASDLVPTMDAWTKLARSTQTGHRIQFFC